MPENSQTNLERVWEKYGNYDYFNRDILPYELASKGVLVTFKAGSTVIYAGDFPEYVYFISSGVVQGKRQYNDGNDYHYFTLNPRNGSVGLLELFARKTEAIATITAKTDVTALRIRSDILYEHVMNDTVALRRCLHIVAFDLYKRSGNDGLLYYKNGVDLVKYFLMGYYEDHADGSGSRVPININYDTIATHIGVCSRTVGRSMKELREAGLICCEKKKFSLTPEQYEQIKSEFLI